MEDFLFGGIFLAVYLWFRFYKAPSRAQRFSPNRTHRAILAVLPLSCLVLIAVVAWKWSSSDVRSQPIWVVLYAIGGAAWLEIGLFLFSLLGVSMRDDVIERQNRAAAWVLYGAMMGTTFCYAGSIIGAGPGLEDDLFCAVLATVFLFAFWFLLERAFRLADRITIERDEGAGIRAGTWMLSLGLIFGGAVTGRWVSVDTTVRDFFRYGWVALAFLAAAAAVEMVCKSLRCTRRRQRVLSVAVAFFYVVAAIVYVAERGIQ